MDLTNSDRARKKKIRTNIKANIRAEKQTKKRLKKFKSHAYQKLNRKINKSILDFFDHSPLVRKLKTEKRLGIVIVNQANDYSSSQSFSDAGRNEIIHANEKAHQIFEFGEYNLIGKPLNFIFQRVKDDCYCVDKDYSLFKNRGVVAGELERNEGEKHIWASTGNNKSVELRVFYINDPVHKLLGIFFCSYDKNDLPSENIENTEAFCELKIELTEQVKALELDYRLKKNFESLVNFWKKTAIVLISVMFVPSIGLGLLVAGVQGNKYGEHATPLYEEYLEEPIKRKVDSKIKYKKFESSQTSN